MANINTKPVAEAFDPAADYLFASVGNTLRRIPVGLLLAPSGPVYVGSSARFTAVDGGCKLEVSADGGTTWQDGPSWVAT